MLWMTSNNRGVTELEIKTMIPEPVLQQNLKFIANLFVSGHLLLGTYLLNYQQALKVALQVVDLLCYE